MLYLDIIIPLQIFSGRRTGSCYSCELGFFLFPCKRGFPLLLQGGDPLPEVLGWIADGLGRGFPPTSQIASVQIKSHQLY
jgi:hypothetical protein